MERSVVCDIYNTKYNFLLCFRLSAIQMAPSFSTMSCGKLMDVFSTDIGLLFFFLDHSRSTYSMKQNDTFGSERGFWRTGGVVGNAGGTMILKLRRSAARLLLGNVKSLLAALGYISRAYVRVHERACVREAGWIATAFGCD